MSAPESAATDRAPVRPLQHVPAVWFDQARDLFGFRIGVDRSWFVILFLMIFWLSGAFRKALHSSDGVAYLTTVVTVLVLFGSLIVHELGHALVARRQGIEVQRIDLFLFGGLTQMSRDAATPGEEFKIAAAGPAGDVRVRARVPGRRPGDRRPAPAGPRRRARRRRSAITPVLLSLSWLLFWNVLLLVVQPDPGVPARRRADRPRDRLAGHAARSARARASRPGSARASRSCWPASASG